MPQAFVVVFYLGYESLFVLLSNATRASSEEIKISFSVSYPQIISGVSRLSSVFSDDHGWMSKQENTGSLCFDTTE